MVYLYSGSVITNCTSVFNVSPNSVIKSENELFTVLTSVIRIYCSGVNNSAAGFTGCIGVLPL